MCLVALALGRSAHFPFVLASNRDEFYERPAAPLAWWAPDPGSAPILAGRDLQGGGTWLGLSATGRLGLVTNVRDPARHDPQARSRGELVTRWLAGHEDFEQLWAACEPTAYNGFNLVAADLRLGRAHWASNATGATQPLQAGVYGLSNAALDTPWPKTAALKARLAQALAFESFEPLAEALFEALADRRAALDEALPSTGVPLALERELSPAFIRTADGRYGTRCSTLVVVERTPGEADTVHVVEHRHDAAPGEPPRRHERLGLPRVGAAS